MFLMFIHVHISTLMTKERLALNFFVVCRPKLFILLSLKFKRLIIYSSCNLIV